MKSTAVGNRPRGEVGSIQETQMIDSCSWMGGVKKMGVYDLNAWVKMMTLNETGN